jgi:hypothetical protein
MATKKISELTSLVTPANDDVLPIVDTSETDTKKITAQNLQDYILGEVTPTELSYVHGVTSSIQTQIDGKLSEDLKATGSDITAGTEDTKYVTSKAIKDADLNTRLKSKIITATRDASGATGSVAYTGVGFRPSTVECFMVVDGTLYQSKGVCDSSLTNRCHYQSAANVYYEIVNIACYSNQTTWAQRGSITAFGDDGFTIAWTKDGTPVAGTLKLVFICYR